MWQKNSCIAVADVAAATWEDVKKRSIAWELEYMIQPMGIQNQVKSSTRDRGCCFEFHAQAYVKIQRSQVAYLLLPK